MSTQTPYRIPHEIQNSTPARTNNIDRMVFQLKFFILTIWLIFIGSFLFFYLFFLHGWEHWDLNPDRRVSSWVIAPVIHHLSDDPSLIIPVTGARNDAGLHHAPKWINLCFSSCSLLTSHSFLPPFPAHFPSFLPDSWTPFHCIASKYIILWLSPLKR